jgi:hypothetical protein
MEMKDKIREIKNLYQKIGNYIYIMELNHRKIRTFSN